MGDIRSMGVAAGVGGRDSIGESGLVRTDVSKNDWGGSFTWL